MDSKPSPSLSKDDLLALSKEELVSIIESIQDKKKQANQPNSSSSSSSSSSTSAKKAKKKEFVFEDYGSNVVAFKIAYLGWEYHALSQSHPNDNSVEDHLFKALFKAKFVKDKESSGYTRCGRTDVGVSAFTQVISLKLRSNFQLKEIAAMDPSAPLVKKVKKEFDYASILNNMLPPSIRVYGSAHVASTFNSRHDCTGRKYKYFFFKKGMNLKKLLEAGKKLVGTHDFRNFCRMELTNSPTFVRDIQSFSVQRFSLFDGKSKDEDDIEGYEDDSDTMAFTMTIAGSGFLWHQIRCIATILFLVGSEREDPSVVDTLLDIEKTPRRPTYDYAPELPLVLWDNTIDGVDWKHPPELIESACQALDKSLTDNLIKANILRSMVVGLRTLAPQDQQEEEEGGEHPQGFDPETQSTIGRKRRYTRLLDRSLLPSLEETVDSLPPKKRQVYEHKLAMSERFNAGKRTGLNATPSEDSDHEQD